MKVLLFTGVFKHQPLQKVAQIASRIGYNGLEIRAASHLPLDATLGEVREMKHILDSYGLVVPVVYLMNGNYAREDEQQIQRQLDRLKIYAELASELGAEMICHSPGGPAPDETVEEDYDRVAFWIEKIAEELGQAKLKLVMEIHHRGIVETVASSLKLVNKINRPNVGLILDPGNMAIANEDYGERSVRQLGNRLFHVHVKDIHFYHHKPELKKTVSYKQNIFAVELMGRGHVDHRPTYKALLETNYTGYVTLEAQVEGVSPEQIARHEFIAFKVGLNSCREV